MRRLKSTTRRTREASRRVALRAGGAALALAAVCSMAITTGSAQAIVLTDAGTTAGVSLTPSSRGNGLPTGVNAVIPSGSCTDPWLAADLGGPAIPTGGLCYQGGPVMHKNETFALTWDQQRAYWSETRSYVEQFLRDVADSSGSLNSPFAVSTQYNDGGGRAQNASLFGGGCIDYGITGGSACEYGSPSGSGHNFPANACTPGGDSFIDTNLVLDNSVCLTDAQLQTEISTMVNQTGIAGRTQPGYTPLVTLLLPPGVETCLDASHTLCSANGLLTPPPSTVTASATGGSIPAGTYGVEVTYVTGGGQTVSSSSQTITTTGGTSTITIQSPPAASGVTGWYAYVTQPNGDVYMRQGSTPNTIGVDDTLTNQPTTGSTPPATTAFCSYHSQVNVGGTEVSYVVQPWTAGTGCDESGVPNIPTDATAPQLATGVGQRLVSPLSQSMTAAITDPGLNGWVAGDASEIDDNGGCAPLPRALDSITLGTSSQNPYFLQREFNNAGVLEFDPITYYGCAPVVNLEPTFVVPSAVDQGDVVQFDGSDTPSTLMVANGGYAWSFGDGTTATGPSVVHSYAKGGVYTVTLTVTDRGANTATQSESILVLGSSGQTPTPAPTTQPGTTTTSTLAPAFQVRLQLNPQSLKAVLSRGIALRVRSNKAADAILTVSISRAEAKRAHIKLGRGSTVVIGRGTSSSILDGVSQLTLHLPSSDVAKLKKLRHATFSVRISLVAAGGGHLAVDAAGSY